VTVIPAVVPVSAALESAALHEPLSVQEDLRRYHEGMIDRVQQRLRCAGFAVEPRILEGDPRERILDLVEREAVSLLILGSHGRTGIARLLLGSVSSHAVVHSSCSVLVVKAA
jgi:nucleotide-binding universal stress UspA family protein